MRSRYAHQGAGSEYSLLINVRRFEYGHRWEVRSDRIEDAIRAQLERYVRSGDLHRAYGAELNRRASAVPRQRDVLASRLRRLDEQLARLRQLYEYGNTTGMRSLSSAPRFRANSRDCATRPPLLTTVATWNGAVHRLSIWSLPGITPTRGSALSS